MRWVNNQFARATWKNSLLFTFSSELYSRELLDVYLSRALNVDLEDGRLTPIDDCKYVLTLDFTIKMLNIHERSVQVFFKEMWLCIVLHVSSKNLRITVLIACQMAISVSLPPFSTHSPQVQVWCPSDHWGWDRGWEDGPFGDAVQAVEPRTGVRVEETIPRSVGLHEGGIYEEETLHRCLWQVPGVSQLACMCFVLRNYSQKIGKMTHVLGVCSSIVFYIILHHSQPLHKTHHGQTLHNTSLWTSLT